jgi:hypothetical protein
LGTITVLFWVLLVWVAWPLGFVLFLPYLAQLYTRVEDARRRIPAPWHLGGGPGYLFRFLGKLIITPVLPLALCFAIALPGTEDPTTARGDGLTVIAAMKAQPVGAGAAACILALIPLAVILLFRTGSPFTSLDPIVLWSILKRGATRYLSLLFSMLMSAAVCFVLFLGMTLTPVGRMSVPVVDLMAPPPLYLVIPGVIGFLWWTVIMAIHGRWIGWTLGEESGEDVPTK